MGWFSWKRVGSDPYYASYEKSFEKIEKKCDTIEVRLQQLPDQLLTMGWRGLAYPGNIL